MGEKDISSSAAGVILDRPAKPVFLDLTWVAGQASPHVFQIVLYGAAGEEITRSKPLLSSFTVQRMRLRAPPSTDYGTYQNEVPVVRIRNESATAGSVMLSFNLKMLYKPTDSVNVE